MVSGCRLDTPSRWLELSVPPPSSSEFHSQWPVTQSIMPRPWSLHKTPKWLCFKELPGWWTHGGLGRVALLERHGSFMPFPMPCPMLLFHLAVPELHCFITNWQSSKWNSVSHSSMLIGPKEEVLGAPELQGIGRKQRGQPGLSVGLWSSGAGQSGGTVHLSCGIWCCLHVNIVRTELLVWWNGKKKHVLKYQTHNVWTYNIIWTIVKGWTARCSGKSTALGTRRYINLESSLGFATL